jgi:hypothetical protein
MYSFTNKRLTKASIVPDLFEDGNINYQQLGTFFINPASYSESKSANWASHQIPGLSDPHHQWTSSGARIINFEALVTNDISSGQAEYKRNASINSAPGKTSIIKKIGGIAKQIFNVPDISDLSNANNQRAGEIYDLNINDKLNYYRSLLYPTVSGNSNAVTAAPYKIRLLVGSVFGNRSFNSSLFIVNKVDIDITKMNAALMPIEARVTFTLTEVTSYNISADSVLTDT